MTEKGHKMTSTNKIRTAEDSDRCMAAVRPVDEAFRTSEQKWGCGRLERLINPDTYAAYRRGWDQYRQALDEGDAEALEALAPRMCAALAFMDGEASAAGHQPLDCSVWETPLGDGTTLLVVRSQAEQSAVLRAIGGAARGMSATSRPNGGMFATAAQPETPPEPDLVEETRLPPDLMIAVRALHEGRALEVWTIGELARLVEAHAAAPVRLARKWQGTPAWSGVQHDEGAAADQVRRGYPLAEPSTGHGGKLVNDPLPF
jgi:hypothetical protein